MNCPVCGAETSGEVCTTCGTRISGTSSFSLSGNANVGTPTPTPKFNDIQQPPMDDFSDLENQPFNIGIGGNMNGNMGNMNGNMGNMNGNMNGGMNEYPVYSTPTPKKSKSGAFSGIIIAAVFIVMAIIGGVSLLSSKKAISECEKVIDTFVTGLEKGDSSKLVSIIDPAASGGATAETMEQLGSVMSLLLGMGAELDIDYTIENRSKPTNSSIREMCSDLYGDAGMSKKIGKAYVFKLNVTMTASFMGESQSDSRIMYMLCYEKGGKYYVWAEDVDLNFD